VCAGGSGFACVQKQIKECNLLQSESRLERGLGGVYVKVSGDARLLSR
jgi:hypothetical protein